MQTHHEHPAVLDYAGEQLIPLADDELHHVATQFMHQQKPGHTLQATALMHDAYLRLGGDKKAEWESRAHFLRIFGGLNVEETGRVLGISPRTVNREWTLAKAWLKKEMAG